MLRHDTVAQLTIIVSWLVASRNVLKREEREWSKQFGAYT